MCPVYPARLLSNWIKDGWAANGLCIVTLDCRKPTSAGFPHLAYRSSVGL
ncbi:MAG: hypothetical protein V9G16_04730 [Nitrosomonas sp.]